MAKSYGTDRARHLPAALLVFTLCCHTAFAAEPTGPERKKIMDAARPFIAAAAGQEVRIKVDWLNVAEGWAILSGRPVTPSGEPANWTALESCYTSQGELGFWSLLSKSNGSWKPHRTVYCAAQLPSEWYLQGSSQYFGLCEIYRGLKDDDGRQIEELCRAGKPRKP